MITVSPHNTCVGTIAQSLVLGLTAFINSLLICGDVVRGMLLICWRTSTQGWLGFCATLGGMVVTPKMCTFVASLLGATFWHSSFLLR